MDLKWRTGVGWPSLISLVVFIIGAIKTSGIIQGVCIVLAVIVAAQVGYSFYRWNGSPWRRVHFRGMLLFARVAGLENAQAQAEGRPYDIEKACTQLAIQMCGQGKKIFVLAMISELVREKGDYLTNLLMSHKTKLFPDLSEESFARVIELTRQFDFGPKLVICNIVENTYGPEEAARYAKAILTNDAF